MVFQNTRVSLDTFEMFVNRPENADKLFEFVAGVIVEVPSNPYSSKIICRSPSRRKTCGN